MTVRRTIMTCVAVVGMATALYAQPTSKTEKVAGTAGHELTTKMTGEVVWVQGNWLVAKMQPSGRYEVFDVQPGREFWIDGQSRHIGDLKLGTVLNAMVITKTQPVTVRTISSVSGTVFWVQGNFVILTHENGENREYNVPESTKFMVEGKPASVKELRAGMKVSATKVVAEPQTVISTETVITGSAPK
jgi:hypothetical protein